MTFAQCQKYAINKAHDAKTRFEQLDLTFQSEKHAMKKAGAEGTSYVMIKCPFKLIYKMEFELIRREDKHIHTVDHTEND